MIKFIDLFCGTGGIRLGVEQAFAESGIAVKCVKSAEIDKKACETYQLNFNENPYCDVHEIDNLSHFDVLLAGFPCQSFSYAGKQLGFSDTRGTLFFEVERILKKHKPRLVFLENVRGLTTHDKGKTFKTILNSLESLGYHVQYRLLNSSNYGIPQNRVRIYIIAYLDENPIITLPDDLGATDSHDFQDYSTSLFLYGDYTFKNVKDILEENPDKKYDCSEWFVEKLRKTLEDNLDKIHGIRLIDTRHGNSIHSWDIGIKGECSKEEIFFMNSLISNRRKHIFGTHQDGKPLTKEQISTFYTNENLDKVIDSLLEKGYLSKKDDKYNPVCGNMSFEVFKFLDPNSISITLTASDSHKLGIYHNGRIRRLTPRECARLQGYPDWYKLHPEDQYAYKQLGNAVSVPVIKKLFVDFLSNNNYINTVDKTSIACS
ncbi:MAG: DNA (cytosine-5-)-methyltransferase [Victivallaceae bacterium]